MRSRIHWVLFAFFVGSAVQAMARAEVPPETSVPRERLAKLTAELPAVSQGGRTLNHSLKEWMDALAIPGVSIAIIDDYRVVGAQGFGVTTPGPLGAPVDAGTLFQAASIAKPVTALAVMRQVEQGRLGLDADINAVMETWTLPASDAQSGEPVTLRQLLAHAGGITPGGFAGYPREVPAPSIVQVLDGAAPATNAPARVVARPGAGVAYSGLGYSLLQLALEDQFDQPFETVLQQTVLQPLGMRDSSFRQDLPESLQARVAPGHLGVGAPVPGGWLVHPELAAAGLWTTPHDLATFAIAVANARRGEPGAPISRELAT